MSKNAVSSKSSGEGSEARLSEITLRQDQRRCALFSFFEGRRSLGSRRLKCSGFGLQHLWFCYRRRSRTIAGVTPVDGLGFTHDKFTLRVERNHDVNHGTLHVLLLTYSSIVGSFVERLYRAAWRQRCFQSGREHGREGERGQQPISFATVQLCVLATPSTAPRQCCFAVHWRPPAPRGFSA